MKRSMLTNPAILILLPLSGLLLNCNRDCPEDEYIGEAYLMKESFEKIPYQDHRKVVFLNDQGSEIKYTIIGFEEQFTRKFDNYSLGKICQRRKSETNLVIDSESFSGLLEQESNFTENSLDFYFSLAIKNVNTENPIDTVLVDQVRIVSQPNNRLLIAGVIPPSEIELISSKRGNQLETEEIYATQFLGNITLADKAFSSVYVSDNALPPIYYNFQQGIVAFADQAKNLWVFERFE